MLTTRQIAICSLASALLIAVQLALGFVPGVELVTAVFLAFCYTFGRRCGVVTATAIYSASNQNLVKKTKKALLHKLEEVLD